MRLIEIMKVIGMGVMGVMRVMRVMGPMRVMGLMGPILVDGNRILPILP